MPLRQQSAKWLVRPLLFLCGILLLSICWTRVVEGFQSEKPRPLNCDLVIARYKEDLSWISEFKHISFRNIIIYNKSSEPIHYLLPNCKVIELPNVGTCDHTYLYHILHNYSDLADITFFVPGSADLPYKMSAVREMIATVYEKPRTVLFGTHSHLGVKEELKNFYIDYHQVAYEKNRDISSFPNLTPSEIRPFGAWFDKWFPGLQTTFVTYRGIYALSRNDIQKKSRDFYEAYIDQVSHARFPEAAHYIERAWAALMHPLSSDSFLNLN